jgi:tetratricopeptide (TPR) repeat protein
MKDMKDLLYQKGDVIGGTFEVLGVLGKGGFGIVYLVRLRETGGVFALKTFRDELLADPAARQAFKKESLLWVNLETHPFVLAARGVQEVYGRLFVMMDYVAPDSHGRVSLGDHVAGDRLDANQVLAWAIQFCLGMEHAGAQGIQCHRDIKPANILITENRTLKIGDFGLAAGAELAWRESGGRSGSFAIAGEECGFGFSLTHREGKVRCGTPGYIAPEVYRYEQADVRSDIYSFGLVLWQMAVGSRVPPFMVSWRSDAESFLRAIYEQQMAGRVPQVEGPLGPVIEGCIRPAPSERYGSFTQLRWALERIWERRTGRKFEIPQVGQQTAGFWSNKGASLYGLSRYEEAIGCFDKALEIQPRNAGAWSNKGIALAALRQHEQAIGCFDQALTIDPRDAYAWSNKGNVLQALRRHEEAIRCFDKALEIQPRDEVAWGNKGIALDALGLYLEAIVCYDSALTIDPRLGPTWNNKGNALKALGQHQEAIRCYDKWLAMDPRISIAWNNKGTALHALGRHEQAIACYDKALAIDPSHANAWYNKALSEDQLRHWREAASSYRKVIEFAPPHYAQQIAHARQRIFQLES